MIDTDALATSGSFWRHWDFCDTQSSGGVFVMSQDYRAECMQDDSGAAPPGEATPVAEERKEHALAGHLPEQRRDEQSEEPHSGPQGLS